MPKKKSVFIRSFLSEKERSGLSFFRKGRLKLLHTPKGRIVAQMFTFLAVSVFMYTQALADQPPSWQEFEVPSANGNYVASVILKSTNNLPREWQWSYQVQVFKLSGYSRTLFWSCDIAYDGYPSGILSNDGTTFVRAADFYSDKEPIVNVYRSGELKKEFRGKELNIEKSKIMKTVTGQAWLTYPGSYGFVENEKQPLVLEIKVIGSGKILIDLATFKVEKK